MFVKDLRKEFYEPIVGHRVLVFCAYDADAVCATKIISNLFQCDRIQYTIVPIADLNDLIAAYGERKRSAKYVLLINIGAMFDVVDLFEPDEEQVIFVADSHRPIDVYNVYRDGQLRLLMREDDSDPIPAYEQVFNDELDDDEDDEQGADPAQHERQRDQARFSLEQLEKRKKRREWVTQRERTLFEYSQFSYFGMSSSLLFFELAWKIGKDNLELLWLSIVGTTEQMLAAKIESNVFEATCETLHEHLQRLNDQRDVRAAGVDASDCVSARQANIAYAKDLQLTLYRHWSLYESLRHTQNVACRLRVWHVRGQRRLLELLAEAGLPLAQCKQRYEAMDLELRRNCVQWLEGLAEKYDLGDIVSRSFVLRRTFRAVHSAFDVAHALQALLDAPEGSGILNGSRSQSSQSSSSSQSASQSASLSASQSAVVQRHKRFSQALDALSWTSGAEEMNAGIQLALVQHVATLKQVHDLIDMRSIKSTGPFLYGELPESTADLRLFVRPGRLLQLARHALHAFVASSKNRRLSNLPLLLIACDPLRPESALAVGIPPLAERGTRNLFGRAFIQIGQMLKCQLEPDLFDMSIVRFPIEQKSKLFESLVSLLS
jgi:cell division control protein 45